MKFKHKPKPQYGDTKVIHKFLIFPLRLNNETRWLEYATIKCTAYRYRHMEGFTYVTWDEDEFID